MHWTSKPVIFLCQLSQKTVGKDVSLAKCGIELLNGAPIWGLYCKHITIVNYDSSIINKFGATLTEKARVIIYNCPMFIV